MLNGPERRIHNSEVPKSDPITTERVLVAVAIIGAAAERIAVNNPDPTLNDSLAVIFGTLTYLTAAGSYILHLRRTRNRV